MSGLRVLAGAYASLTADNGIALYGSAESLRSLASIIRNGAPTDINLSAPPEEVLEEGPLRTIRLLAGDDGPVDLRVTGEAIEIAGGASAMAKLAASLENLADTPAFGGEVPRHVDLEYFPGHSFLHERSTWMTVTLLPVLKP
jgi:hypothetical protein